ncbi:RHS repeat-associated core domain-containing protein [Variovorax sp. H27-G14]|uniref:RHS repeat-associated core domain-containing protein n=1 Tax=Variovorax sp. H27-G14 TaxID=3111914 RepID=UPI0038FD0BC5
MATPLTPAQIEKIAAQKETAIVPLTAIAVQDVGAAARIVDSWLRAMTRDWVTLERVMTVAGAIPVLGNILALLDALCDIISLTTDKARDELDKLLLWASMGINLIGILPGAGNAARTALRPTLHLARGALQTSAHAMSEALVGMIVNHLNATLAGDIEKFIDEASTKLESMLGDAGAKAEALTGNWAQGLQKLAAGKIFDDNPPPERPLRDPNKEYSNYWAAVVGALGEKAAKLRQAALLELRKKGNAAFAAGIKSVGADVKLIHAATALKTVGDAVKQKLLAHADKKTVKSIGWLLVRISEAVTRKLARNKGGVQINGKTQARHDRAKGSPEVDGSSAQVTKGIPDPSHCPCPRPKVTTANAISFVSGSETISHTDFALPGLMPIVWSRTYYSRLGAYDQTSHACLGARWITPYTTRIDQAEDGRLTYFGADGRSHEFPSLAGPDPEQPDATGQTHHNPIEHLTLGRGNDGLLILSLGRDLVETFELAPAFWRNAKPDTRNKTAVYRLASQRTRAGQQTELRYRHDGDQLSDIVSGDTHVSTAIDAQGRIHSLWLVQGSQAVRQLASYTYQDRADGSSDLVAASDEDQHAWAYAYQDDSHLVNHYSDRTGRGIHLQWMHEDGFRAAITPANSASAKAYREWADDGSFGTTLVWNDNIRLVTVIDALGARTRCYYDILGYTYRLIYPEVTDPVSQTICAHEEWFVRDANKNVTLHMRPDGSQERYSYDARGNVLSHTRADFSVAHFAYDDKDNLTGIRDAEGHAWKRDYDGINLVEEIDPLGHKTGYAYNEHGLPVEITDAKGGKKKLAYDEAGQLTAYTDCSGKKSSWAYDERGRLVKQRNAAGETTQYHYERGQLAKLTNPDGALEHLEYDAEGRLLAHRDALQRETRYRYSAAGLIVQRTDANRHTIDYQWDRLGRLTALRNENARTYSFSYDPMGKLLAEVQFDGSRTQYAYQSSTGILREVVEGDSATRLDFDPMGRLIARSAALYIEPASRNGMPARRTLDHEHAQTDTYAYDGNGQLTDARNAHIHLQWFHDPAGNVRTEHHHYLIDDWGRPSTQPLTAVWQHRHDELGNRIQTTRPDGHKTSWMTYGSGHVHGLMLDDVEALQIERDDLHREVKRTQANQIAEERQYDPAGRLKAQVLNRAERFSQSAGNTISSAFNLRRSYQYDRAGQLTDIGDSRRGGLSYSYDPVGRLVQSHSQRGSETFAFDPASNILDPTAPAARQAGTLNNTPAILDNLVKDYAGTHFAYDARGNMTQRLHNGQNTRFVWDALGRMSAARTQDTHTTFLYDPLGRRIAKRSEPIIVVSSDNGSRYRETEYWRQMKERNLGTTLFGWDGDQMVWESDSARQRTVHYVFEPDSFVPLMQARTEQGMTNSFLRRPADVAGAYMGDTGDYDMDTDPLFNGMFEPGLGKDGELPPLENIHYYQCDHLGTPMELTDETGQLAWEANYKAWGEARLLLSETAERAGLKNPIRFQGQYLDEETGLHYNRHRYYDPVVGRFVSKDPIGLLGGINLQQYAPNPTRWIDPFGLSAASDLPALRGKRVPQVRSILQKEGFSRTNGNANNENWNHPDGSKVRIHRHGNQSRLDSRGNVTPKSGLNAHIHKQCPLENQLDDNGHATTDPNESHIGIKNPSTLPIVRGRPHGDGA